MSLILPTQTSKKRGYAVWVVAALLAAAIFAGPSLYGFFADQNGVQTIKNSIKSHIPGTYEYDRRRADEASARR